MLSKVLAAFNLGTSAEALPFGSGLINNTWKVTGNHREYILQRINQHVFHTPRDISENISLMADFLSKHHPEYLFTLPEKTIAGKDLYHDTEHGYFRLFPFIRKSHTIDVVQNAEQAFIAASEFGKFTCLLSGFRVHKLKITIPDFHNISLRYSSFLQSLKSAKSERISHARDAIQYILSQDDIVKQFEKITVNPEFKIRVTHHDTKISNVLFDDNDKGLCVIDLDTVMPGYFISDVGDMMRTYLCPVSEEETDFAKIEIRDDIYTAIVEGYSEQMKNELTNTEKQHFMYAGQFMIYMQAIRFLTDYLNSDIYYGAKYPDHNLIRAKNQLVLFKKLSELPHLAKH
ncbi:MAG: aminoglycoside phosphotransferase family protein [Chitinophagaceae bacterium]|nr:aminoglycoside phosphotransferase family protein [Chitinophagaceae bacterium]